MANTKIRIENLDLVGKVQDADVNIGVNDGGTPRTAIQVHGTEGSVSFPRQSLVCANSGAGDQSINDATWTQVTLTGSEFIDNIGEFTSSTFTAKTSGKYLIRADVTWKTGTSGDYYIVGLYANDVYSIGNQSQITSAFTHYPMNVEVILSLSAGGTIKVYVYHDNGANTARTIGEYTGRLTIVKVA
jgi:hypothetical protein